MHTIENNPDMAFLRLLKIMDELREKCPWDKVQTLESLRHLTIEETYELSDSILNHDLEGLKKNSAMCYYILSFMRKLLQNNSFLILQT